MRRIAAVVMALTLLGACATPPDVALPTAPAPSTPTSTTPSTSDKVVTKGMPESEPTEIRIPKIGAKSSLVPLGLNPDETVEVPPVEQPVLDPPATAENALPAAQ